MKFNNHQITAMYYNNHPIIRAYGCDEKIVFGEAPQDEGYILFYRTPNNGMLYTTGSSLVTDVKKYNGGTSLVNNSNYGTNKLIKATCEIEGSVIPNNAFKSTSLIGIEIPNNVTGINNSAFSYLLVGNDYNIDSSETIEIKLPEGLKTIGSQAFYYISRSNSVNNDFYNLGPIIIPSTVTQINARALDFAGDGFTNLVSSKHRSFLLYFKSTTPPTFTGEVFGSIGSKPTRLKNNITIYVPSGCGQAYFDALPYTFDSSITWSDIFTEDSGNNLSYLTNMQNARFGIMDLQAE